jgi:starch synthase (maltosyl-transferring)
MLGAGVVLRAHRRRQPLVGMREAMPGTDRYAAQVTVRREGRWRFQVEAWGDRSRTGATTPASRSRAGLDVGLMMAEGAILFERAANHPPTRRPRSP